MRHVVPSARNVSSTRSSGIVRCARCITIGRVVTELGGRRRGAGAGAPARRARRCGGRSGRRGCGRRAGAAAAAGAAPARAAGSSTIRRTITRRIDHRPRRCGRPGGPAPIAGSSPARICSARNTSTTQNTAPAAVTTGRAPPRSVMPSPPRPCRRRSSKPSVSTPSLSTVVVEVVVVAAAAVAAVVDAVVVAAVVVEAVVVDRRAVRRRRVVEADARRRGRRPETSRGGVAVTAPRLRAAAAGASRRTWTVRRTTSVRTSGCAAAGAGAAASGSSPPAPIATAASAASASERAGGCDACAVQEHGGAGWCRDRPSAIEMPGQALAKPAPSARRAAATLDRVPTRILIVEDEASIAEPFARLLRREGFETTVARTAAEALDAARDDRARPRAARPRAARRRRPRRLPRPARASATSP